MVALPVALADRRVVAESRAVDCADGVRLAVRAYRSLDGTPRGAALLVHAMMASGLYLDRPRGEGFASTLARAGLDTYVLDLRGHGGSQPPHPQRDHWSFDDYVRLDLPAALEAVAGWAGVARDRIGYVGHSLGGLAGLAHAVVDPAGASSRMVLVATSLWDVRPGQRDWLLRRLVFGAYVGVARLLGYAPIRRLGIGTDDEPLSYVEELTGWARSGRWRSRDGRVDYREGLVRLRSRLLVVAGGGDRLAPLEDTCALLGSVPPSQIERMTVSLRDGYALDADHFRVLTDPRALPAWLRMADFLVGVD